MLREYPDIKLEIDSDSGLTDIVADRYDAGVRLGEQVARGMIAVPIGPPMRMAAVATPEYFAAHPPPKRPQELTNHRCINLKLPSGLYVWEFEKAGRELNVRVDGPLVVKTSDEMLTAARAGMGIAFTFDDKLDRDLARQAVEARARRLVPAVRGFPFVLSEPAPGLAGVLARYRCPALPEVRTSRRRAASAGVAGVYTIMCRSA